MKPFKMSYICFRFAGRRLEQKQHTTATMVTRRIMMSDPPMQPMMIQRWIESIPSLSGSIPGVSVSGTIQTQTHSDLLKAIHCSFII